MSEIKIPEQINQTFIGLIIGLVALYFTISINFDYWLKIFFIILFSAYSFWMLILSCIQMYKNTWRYLNKEKLQK